MTGEVNEKDIYDVCDNTQTQRLNQLSSSQVLIFPKCHTKKPSAICNFIPPLHTKAQNVTRSTCASSELLTVVANDSNLVGHYMMLPAKQLPMFQRITAFTFSVLG